MDSIKVCKDVMLLELTALFMGKSANTATLGNWQQLFKTNTCNYDGAILLPL